ncbi:MAG TPA: SUMF1/EgtB/PvdO family nonheme iron enzyme [Bacteroidales bacterium]|nr:SUMF1/EgtB/PvdO family nonheme iron enzyme [Bacteroidales bacterium]HPS16013.1 SUMF1/EgtB/PvdO family nonheme iron enzyme [Bacteroidales bacterium]
MKKLLISFSAILILLGILTSCNNSGKGQLIGVQDRPDWYQPDPYGMLFIHMGSYNMGNSDQDVPYAQISPSKTVSVQAFYMDETEITNNEYRQFVYWVRDSIAHRKLGEQLEEHLITENEETGETYEPPYINWKAKIEWDGTDEEQRDILNTMYISEQERFYRRKELDPRMFNYDYSYIDFKAAAAKDYSSSNLTAGSLNNNRPQGLKDRSVYIIKKTINIFPDTLAFVHDFTYSFNDPMTQNYFWHPAYDNYPVVGVNWVQARAFCIWRTLLMNSWLYSQEESYVNDFRLPTESEWEWAARGDLDLSPFPWGGPYIRNSNGCFLGNYKPLRGNYLDDGGFHTVVVGHYAPNDFGLYDMGGNVAEWTSNAFDESAYNFAHDLNMDYRYEAKDTDPPALKRKVIRGGSWKDVGYFMQTGTRTYEYQDTAKSYIGFRCVQTYLGRDKNDGPNASNVYN